MKHAILNYALACVLSLVAAQAAVPGLINYQGRLTDSNGDPVTGSKTLAVAIYDAASGGNLLYSETIGAVTLDANGVYSFQFGSAGTSVVNKSELVGTTDGSLTVYNKVLGETALANTVSVTDGTYTWSQSGGSSSPTNFTGSFDSGSGTVSAIYLSGAPPAGREITASYDYEAAGITGALGEGNQHWLELSVDGVQQATRDRVLAVPFALRAAHADNAAEITTKTNKTIHVRTAFYNNAQGHERKIANLPYGWSAGQYSNPPDYLLIPIDVYRVSKIHQIRANVFNNIYAQYGIDHSWGRCTIRLYQVNDSGAVLLTSQVLEKVPGDLIIDYPVELDEKFAYYIEVILSAVRNPIYSGSPWYASSRIDTMQILCDWR